VTDSQLRVGREHVFIDPDGDRKRLQAPQILGEGGEWALGAGAEPLGDRNQAAQVEVADHEWIVAEVVDRRPVALGPGQPVVGL
jgi:hypothetical protein